MLPGLWSYPSKDCRGGPRLRVWETSDSWRTSTSVTVETVGIVVSVSYEHVRNSCLKGSGGVCGEVDGLVWRFHGPLVGVKRVVSITGSCGFLFGETDLWRGGSRFRVTDPLVPNGVGGTDRRHVWRTPGLLFGWVERWWCWWSVDTHYVLQTPYREGV